MAATALDNNTITRTESVLLSHTGCCMHVFLLLLATHSICDFLEFVTFISKTRLRQTGSRIALLESVKRFYSHCTVTLRRCCSETATNKLCSAIVLGILPPLFVRFRYPLTVSNDTSKRPMPTPARSMLMSSYRLTVTSSAACNTHLGTYQYVSEQSCTGMQMYVCVCVLYCACNLSTCLFLSC